MRRVISPPGGLISITSAPKSASRRVGAGRQLVKSMTCRERKACSLNQRHQAVLSLGRDERQPSFGAVFETPSLHYVISEHPSILRAFRSL
jgi:hypothetical protein